MKVKEIDLLQKNLHGFRRVIVELEDTIIDAQIRNFKSKFGVEMKIDKPGEIELVTNWISKVDPHFSKHVNTPYSLSGKKNNKPSLMGVFIVKIAPWTYMYVDAKSSGYSREDECERNSIFIYIFGKKAFKVFAHLSKYISDKNTSVNRIYSIVGVSHGDQSHWTCTASTLTPRTMDTIFMDKEQKKRITDHIDQWLRNEEMYKSRGLLYKTGILLHGKAGTGKSSMAMAIANYLGCGLITIDSPSFDHMNIPEITESIVSDETNYVVLLDEIDTIFKSRDDETSTDAQTARTAKLLSFLDSPQSPTGVIFVATTNYIDRLDKALLRKGRFDLVEEMNDITGPVAMEMCRSFKLTDKEIYENLQKNNGKLDLSDDAMFNPAELQDIILSYLKEKDLKMSDIIIDEPEEATEDKPNEEPEPVKVTKSKKRTKGTEVVKSRQDLIDKHVKKEDPVE